MDPVTLTIIICIVATVLVVDFYKREQRRVTANLHNDNLKQLLTITALDCKFGDEANLSDSGSNQRVADQITQLINCYENGEIQQDVFQTKMDSLLTKLN